MPVFRMKNPQSGLWEPLLMGSREPPYEQRIKTANYTFILDDAWRVIEHNSTTAHTFTMPPYSAVAWPAGVQIDLLNVNTGDLTVAGGVGVTINSRDGLTLDGRWAGATLMNRATDLWVLVGTLKA